MYYGNEISHTPSFRRLGARCRWAAQALDNQHRLGQNMQGAVPSGDRFMPNADLRPPVSPWGNRITWGLIVVFGLLFLGLTTYRIRARDLHEENAEKVAELSAALPKTVPKPGQSADWPQWRGPNRDGASPETGLLAAWPDAGPKELWRQAAGPGYSSVVVAQGRAVTMVQDGDEEAVVCWDAATGAEQWRFKYPAHFRHRQFGDGPRSTPSIAGDRLYTVGGTGVMHCLKLFPATATGEAAWRRDLITDQGGPQLEWGISCSPLVERGLVYVLRGGGGTGSIHRTPSNALAALRTDSGDFVWEAFDDRAGYSSPVAADLAGQRQIILLTAERLMGVLPADGTLLWEFPWPDGPAHTPSSIITPVVLHRDIGDYVFIAGGYDKGCALIKIERDGDGFAARPVYRNLNMRSVFSSPVVNGDFLYGFDDINLACLDVRTGKRKWKEHGFGKGSVLLADGHLIMLGDDGTLAMAAADPSGYQEEGRFQHSDQRASWTVPTLAGGRLYVRDFAHVVCYDLKKSP
jgi:outer membrane protein assembly factor BamB